MLDDIASEIDVDKLEPPADAKYRSFGLRKGIQQGKLRFVQSDIDILGTMIGLVEPGWMDISAAGKQETVITGCLVWIKQNVIIGAAGFQGSLIVLCVFWSTCN